MPKYGQDVTNIGGADLGAAKDIRPGIASDPGRAAEISARGQANASLIQNLGNTAVEAYKGYQYASLETDIQQASDAYVDTRQARDDVGSTRQAIDNIWNNFDASIEDVNPVEIKHREALDRYKRGVEQGVSTPEQFNARVVALTRSAIAKNPGLRQELLGHAKNALEDSGITKILKIDQDQIDYQNKLSQDYQKQLFDMAIKQGIDPATDPNYAAKVFYNNAQQTAYETALKGQQVKKGAIEALVSEPELFKSITDGATVKLTTTLATIANDPTISKENKAILIGIRAQEEITRYQSLFGTSAGLPQVGGSVERLKGLATLYTSFANGDLTQKALENQLAIRKATNELSLDLDKQEKVARIIGSLGPTAGLSKSLTNLAKSVSESLDGVSFNVPASTPRDSHVIGGVLGSVLETAKKDPAGVPVVANVLESFHKEVYSSSRNTQEKIIFSDEYVRALATPGSNEVLNKLDSKDRFQAIQDSRQYLDLYATFIKSAKTFGPGPNHGKLIVRPGDLQLDALDDGTVGFSSASDPVNARILNSEFGNRLNNSIKAMANLQGHGDAKQIVGKAEFLEALSYIVGISPKAGFEEGVTQAYSGRGTGRDRANFEASKLLEDEHQKNLDKLYPTNLRRRSTDETFPIVPLDKKIPTKGGNPLLDTEGLTAKETFPAKGAAEANARALATEIKSKKPGSKERAILEEEWEKLTGEKWK